jgi:hypothetical protein
MELIWTGFVAALLDLPWKDFMGADIIVVDFSIQPFSDFQRMATMANTILWIDHHKSAIDEWKQQEGHPAWCPIVTLLDTSKAGCELAWDYYYVGKIMPLGVRYLGRYDVWDHEFSENVLPFQYGMRLRDLDPGTGNDRAEWDMVLSTDGSDDCYIAECIRDGETVLKYQVRQDEISAKAGCFGLEWEDLNWICANHGGRGSKFFDSVWEPDQYDGMMGFSWNGEQWTFGLYSNKPEIDCGALAKKYGGGGHPGAAGFRTKELPFDLANSIALSFS